MSSIVNVNTHTYNVTYVTGQMLRTLRLMICWIGLDPKKITEDWAVLERAINTWILSGHLEAVMLEIYHPASGALITRCDFNIDYGYGNGDGSMWTDTEAVRFAIVKFGTIPSCCHYRILTTTKIGRPDVPGMGSATFLSTDGFIKQSLGTSVGTGTIGAQAAYWRKI
jgi:hypothetical protein